MYPINEIFEDYLKKRGRTWDVFVEVNDVIYGKDKIVDLTIENSLTPGSDFTIGAAVSSKMTVTLKILEDLPIGAKVVPYVTMSTEDMTWIEANFAWDHANFEWIGGTLEGMPLGEFYIDTRGKVNDNYTFVCLDRLVLANSAYISQLDYPVTMVDVWNEICISIEVENATNVTLKPYTLNAAPTGFTMREVLGYIAAVNCGSVYIGKDGKLVLRKFSAADNPVFDLDTEDYFRLKEINPTRTFTRIEVTYDVEDKLTYQAGSGDENSTISIINPLATQTIVNEMLTDLNGFSFLPLEIDARGFPQLELGDRLTVARQESNSWLNTTTAWQDTELTWEGKTYHQTILTSLKYSFKGGLSTSIKSASKSTQQSEFNNPKVLDQQIERQTKNSLKFNKPYYGVTHSRTEGIVVQREDGSAKAVFNADELSFWADGERSLWFDVPNEEWRFKGTILASNIVGGTITGGEIWGGTIRGSEFYGGTISTRETGYPRIIMSETSNLLTAEYSATRSISIDPNNYLTNHYPHLRFAADGYSGTISHYGSSGLYVDANDVTFMSNVYIQGNHSFHGPDEDDFWVGSYTLAEILDGYVREYDNNIIINNILSRLNSLETAIIQKANKGSSTSSSGGHNHGISDGTILMRYDGSPITYSSYSGHSHTQN
jgi:hypothetical protein